MNKPSPKLACATCCLWDGELASILAEYARIGYTAVELLALEAQRHLDVHAWTGDGLRRYVGGFGLSVAAIYPDPVYLPAGERSTRAMATCRRAIDVAAEAGCPVVVFTPVMFPKEKVDFAALAGLLMELAEHVGTRGVKVCLENHYGFPLSTAEDYEALMRLLPDERLAICHDTGHFTSAGVDQVGFVRRWGRRIGHVHLKDHIGTEGVPLGTGETPLPEVFAALASAGFSGTASVELELKDKTAMSRHLRDARRYCLEVLGLVG